MNVNQFRIGNYVTIHNKKSHEKMINIPLVICGIEKLREDEAGIVRLNFPNEKDNTVLPAFSQFDRYITPIKLTELNILNFDFCKDNSENNKTYLSPMVNGNVIKIYFNRFGDAKFAINTHFSIEIEYVHQLQNLFSVLSGGRELVFSNNA